MGRWNEIRVRVVIKRNETNWTKEHWTCCRFWTWLSDEKRNVLYIYDKPFDILHLKWKIWNPLKINLQDLSTFLQVFPTNLWRLFSEFFQLKISSFWKIKKKCSGTSYFYRQTTIDWSHYPATLLLSFCRCAFCISALFFESLKKMVHVSSDTVNIRIIRACISWRALIKVLFSFFCN